MGDARARTLQQATESLRPIIVLTMGLGADVFKFKGKCPMSEARTSVPIKNTKDQSWTPTSDLLLGLEGELSMYT